MSLSSKLQARVQRNKQTVGQLQRKHAELSKALLQLRSVRRDAKSPQSKDLSRQVVRSSIALRAIVAGSAKEAAGELRDTEKTVAGLSQGASMQVSTQAGDKQTALLDALQAAHERLRALIEAAAAVGEMLALLQHELQVLRGSQAQLTASQAAENPELAAELQKLDQDIRALEAQIQSLLSKLRDLEKAIQEQQQRIQSLQQQLAAENAKEQAAPRSPKPVSFSQAPRLK